MGIVDVVSKFIYAVLLVVLYHLSCYMIVCWTTRFLILVKHKNTCHRKMYGILLSENYDSYEDDA
jgi:hypothetical protein